MEPPTPRIPDRLKGYTSALQKLSARTGTPITSLAVSFAILHELTALVPLVGVYWGARTFGVGDKMTSYFSKRENSGVDEPKDAGVINETLSAWAKEGERRMVRVGARYGVFGFEKGQKVTEEDMSKLGDTVAREVANGAFAYIAVKALLPVRIGASLYLSPAFSRRFLNPVTRVMKGLFKR